MRILLTGGGTGGHIYPALAVARRLKETESNVELLYIGTERGLESSIVPDEGIPFKTIKIEGFKRKLNIQGIAYNLKSVGLFLESIYRARKIIREFKPDAVLGTGGYVSAPICYVAAKENIPTIVHEQNSYLGLTNKFLIRYIDRLAISFKNVFEQTEKYADKVVFTGNPRAQEVASLQDDENEFNQIDDKQPLILIFGGSRGAEKINWAVVDSYNTLRKRPYQFVFVTGEIHYEKICRQLNHISPLNENKNFIVKPYIKQMTGLLKKAALVVSRSGATTIAEITALGIPSILIPSPYVTDDHQTKNAMSLVENRAAELLTENELSKDSLTSQIDEIMLNEKHRLFMKEKALEIGEPKAADKLIEIMFDEMNK